MPRKDPTERKEYYKDYKILNWEKYQESQRHCAKAWRANNKKKYCVYCQKHLSEQVFAKHKRTQGHQVKFMNHQNMRVPFLNDILN